MAHFRAGHRVQCYANIDAEIDMAGAAITTASQALWDLRKFTNRWHDEVPRFHCIFSLSVVKFTSLVLPNSVGRCSDSRHELACRSVHHGQDGSSRTCFLCATAAISYAALSIAIC